MDIPPQELGRVSSSVLWRGAAGLICIKAVFLLKKTWKPWKSRKPQTFLGLMS